MKNKLKIHSKISSDFSGGVSPKPSTLKPGLRENIIHANLVIGLYNDGMVRILKDRFEGQASLGRRANGKLVIRKASQMISASVFGENDLTIFSEGLAREIEEAINETIRSFHKKEG
jgi:hypothetical protein